MVIICTATLVRAFRGGLRSRATPKAYEKLLLGRTSLFATSVTLSSGISSIVPSGSGSDEKGDIMKIDAGKHSYNLHKTKKPAVIFVLGGPGAGKGTQCEKLTKQYGMKHISAGDLLREERASGSANGQLIDTCLKEGNIVPVKITLDLLKEAILDSKCNRYLIDGFPRNYDNLNGWIDSNMDDVCDVEGCLFFDCPESELEKRLLERGKTSGRSDDNLESARKRFATYKSSTLPIVDYYASKDMLMQVSGDQAVEFVEKDVQAHIQPHITEEITYLTKQQMYALSTGNWELYSSLCQPTMTSFETKPESDSNNFSNESVRGIDAHRRYFIQMSNSSMDLKEGETQISEILEKPLVRIIGKVGVISYVRTVTSKRLTLTNENEQEISASACDSDSDSAGKTTYKIHTERFHETKIWSLNDGTWQTVHSHMSGSI